MRRLAATVVSLAAALALMLVLGGASDESSETREYRLLFDNAFGLVEGGDFRVGGVNAGQTTEFDVEKRGRRTLAAVTVEVQEPGIPAFRTDARCAVRPQSLIGEYYVDCQPGEAREALPEGGTVEVDQTESTIPIDLVNDILRRPYRERLRVLVSTLGTGLAGRSDALAEALRRAHPGLRETSQTLQILGRQNRIIEDFIADADTVVAELERNKSDVARWVEEAGEAAEISASRREDISASFERLPGFLDELRPAMARLDDLAVQQVPLLTDLQAAAPDLDRFFAELGPLANASRPAIRTLGSASEAGTRAFREGAEEVAQLRALAADAGPTARPLRQFLQTLDDRERSIEDDPRSRVGSPPEPDRTAGRGAGGFTGLEAVWNWVYWSGLSLNGFDQVSHILRVSAVVSACTDLETKFGDDPDDPSWYEECNQWLGPDQPGITSPDPTDGSAASRALLERDGAPPRRVGERRGPGEPEAGPRPGQRDLSVPQIRLPASIQQLLDQLPRLAEGTDPSALSGLSRELGARSPAAETVLDYLLGP